MKCQDIGNAYETHVHVFGLSRKSNINEHSWHRYTKFINESESSVILTVLYIVVRVVVS